MDLKTGIYAMEHSGLMIVDSGSCGNILSSQLSVSLGVRQKLNEAADEICVLSGETLSAKPVHFPFVMGGMQFREKFDMCVCNIPQVTGEVPVIGILGVQFLQSHSLVIDFRDFSLHTSNISSVGLSKSGCDFYFPMEIGIRDYGLHVLFMCQDDLEITALVDTGASDNLFSVLPLTDAGFNCIYTDGEKNIYGLTGQTKAQSAVIDFELISAAAEDDEKSIARKDSFLVIPYYPLEPQEENQGENYGQLKPIEAIIGSPFMAKENWVLDFGVGVI